MAERLTARDESPLPIRSTPHDSEVRELLEVYQQVLDTVNDLSPVPMVLRKHRGRLHYLPRAKWPVRYFVIRHIRRTLASLNRRYSARAALGRAPHGEQQDREAVRDFEQSLPPDRHKLYVVVLSAAILVLLQLMIRGYIRYMPAADINPQVREQIIQKLLDEVTKVLPALSPNFSSINDALDAVWTGRPGPFAFLTLCSAFVAYVALRPVVPAFRLKRMLFNLAAEPGRWSNSAVARWSDSHATGLYEREHRVFAALVTRPPREFPFDLAVSALALAFPAVVCASFYYFAAVFPPMQTLLWVELATCLLILIVLRLGWLYRTRLRRKACRAVPYMPFEVRIRGGNAIAKVEQPLGLRLLISLLVVGFELMLNSYGPMGATYLDAFAFASPEVWAVWLLISLPWWYRINRELRDLDNTYGSRHASGRPLVSLLMMAAGCPAILPLPYGAIVVFAIYLPFIAVFRLGRHIRRAQARAGQRRKVLSPWILAPALVLAPLLFAYIQKQMNEIWAAQGQLLDPSPAAASPEVNWSTGTLPWLKSPKGRTTEPSRACRASTPAWNHHPNGSADDTDREGELGGRKYAAPPNPV